MSCVWSVSVSAVRMLVALARKPGMFSQDRDMYADRRQEKILLGGVSHFRRCFAQLVPRCSGESVSEALLERGVLCDKREYQLVQVCGRGVGRQ